MLLISEIDMNIPIDSPREKDYDRVVIIGERGIHRSVR